MSDKPGYVSGALGLPARLALLLAGVVGAVAGLWRGSGAPFALFLARPRGRLLDAVRAMGAPESMERDWRARRDARVNDSLRLLVAIDGTRVDARDARLLGTEIDDLKAELARPPQGSAREAQALRLEVRERRAGGRARLGERREAAATRFETPEDLLRELQEQARAGRDAAAFGERLPRLSAQVEAAGETVAALDRASEVSSQRAEGAS